MKKTIYVLGLLIVWALLANAYVQWEHNDKLLFEDMMTIEEWSITQRVHFIDTLHAHRMYGNLSLASSLLVAYTMVVFAKPKS